MELGEVMLYSFMGVMAISITFHGIVKKLLVAPVLVDIIASSYFVSAYLTTGTISGIQIAIGSVITVTVTIRVQRWLLGFERMTVEGDPDFGRVMAHIITGIAFWIRTSIAALFMGKQATPPALFSISWEQVPGLINRPGGPYERAKVLIRKLLQGFSLPRTTSGADAHASAHGELRRDDPGVEPNTGRTPAHRCPAAPKEAGLGTT